MGWWGIDCGINLNDPKVAAIDQHVAFFDPFKCVEGARPEILPRRPARLSPLHDALCCPISSVLSSFDEPPDENVVAERTRVLSNRTRLPNAVKLKIYVYELPPWLYVPAYSGRHRLLSL